MGYRCIDPKLLTDEQLEHLCTLDAKHQRQRYCQYLSDKVLTKEEKKQKVQEEREAKSGNREMVRAAREANPHLVYALGHNSLMLRVNRQNINRWLNMK